MASNALAELLAGLAEIETLQRANPTPLQGGGFTRPDVVRALGRAEVVLLSSHFERYLYALNEEACAAVLDQTPEAGRLPLEVKLVHARDAVDELARTQWDRREAKLRAYSSAGAELWTDTAPVRDIDASRLLAWMKSPEVDSVVRMFRMWGVDNIFGAVTRMPVHQGRLRLRLGELVSKRNNIAHGDQTVEATHLDVLQYKSAVRTFCERADRVMARRLSGILGCVRPW